MKKFFRTFIAITMSITILFANFSFAAYSSSSAKNTYLGLEKNNIKELEKILSKLATSKFIEADILKSGIDLSGINLPGDFDSLKLNAINEFDKKDNYEYNKITLESQSKERISMEVILKDTKLAFNIPELYDKYISFDMSRLDEFLEKFDINLSMKDKEQLENLKYKLLSGKEQSIFSKEEINYIKKIIPIYALKLSELTDSKYFSKQQNTEVEYNNKKIPCDVVVFEIPVSDILNIFNEVWKYAKSDEQLLDILAKSMNSGSNGEVYTKEEIITAFNTIFGKAMVTDNITYCNKMKVSSTLYYNSKKQTIQRTFKINDANKTDDKSDLFSISFITIRGSKNSFYELKFGDFEIRDFVTKTNKKDEHKIEIEVQTYNYDFDEETLEYIKIPDITVTNYSLTIEKVNSKETVLIFCRDEAPENKITLKSKINTNQANKLNGEIQIILTMEDKDYGINAKYSMEAPKKIIKKSFESKEFDLNNETKENIIKEYKESEQALTDKASRIMEELFPETMRASRERIARMKARADIATARQIGMGAIIWRIEDSEANTGISENWKEYSALENFDNYMLLNASCNLENGKFYICKNNEGKIIVGVSDNNALDLPGSFEVTEVNYDGTKSGIVYIEQ